ncbi:hypothetical protein BST61_g8612 [Cercospora zeina]
MKSTSNSTPCQVTTRKRHFGYLLQEFGTRIPYAFHSFSDSKHVSTFDHDRSSFILSAVDFADCRRTTKSNSQQQALLQLRHKVFLWRKIRAFRGLKDPGIVSATARSFKVICEKMPVRAKKD